MHAAPAPVPSDSELAVHVDETCGLDVTTLAMDATRVTLQLQGEMDLSNADLLIAVLGNQVGLGRRFVRLDVSRLAFLDCSGLRAIVEAHNRCLGARGTLVLTGVTPRIARLLAITGLDEALLVADGPGAPRRIRRQQHLAAVAAH
jgi:anti-sigma B factor antagonist